MKKIISMVVVLATLVVPTVTAQKINEASYKAKLEKSDADIANPKKSGKAATWFNRGKLCADAIVAPTKNIFSGLDANMLAVTVGTGANEVKDDVHSFDWIDVCTKNGKVSAWKIKKQVLPNAFTLAKEAFAKAYELDPASAPKIKTALEALINYYSELGSVSLDITEYKTAIDAYCKAVELQQNPAIGKVDARYYFFAGQLAAFLGAQEPQYFADGEKYLTKALDAGYKDEQGNIYYFLFHCYYGQRAANKENLIKAKSALLEGIEKYPRNERIMEGLIQLYTSEDGVGNPADLVERIDKMLTEKPDNAGLWFARGQVFFKLKNFDECINSFLKINELKPNDYDTNFYLGYFYMAKGDEANREFNARLDSISSQEEYQTNLKAVNAAYMKSLPWLEKAMELKPESVDCAEYLKILCFRLRNEDGMMDKYNKYNAIFKKLKGIN
uniref:tetratricopeptide repeat protein n=1 Tax=Alistipes sp. TaxID=1872444 RepID=UPI004055BD51